MKFSEFDDVNEKQDDQILEFDRYRIEVSVHKGKISHSLVCLDAQNKTVKARSSKKKKMQHRFLATPGTYLIGIDLMGIFCNLTA